MRQSNCEPIRYNPNRHTITGVLAVAAVMGMFVTRKSDADETLELATNKAGFILERDVLANKAALTALIEANELRPNKDGFEYPYVAGEPVTAHDHLEVWVEGGAIGAGIDENTAAETQLTTAAGKLVPLTNSATQECAAIVKRNIAAINTEDGRRLLIEIRRGVKTVTP